MTKFNAVDEFLDDRMELPYRGKFYAIPPADAELGLECARTWAIAGKVSQALADAAQLDGPEQQQKLADIEAQFGKVDLDDEEEHELYRRLLGPVWQELQDDGVPWPVIKHMGVTAYVWACSGMADAMLEWERVKPDPTLRPAPQDRLPKQTRSTTRKGGGSGTKRPASTSGTKSPKGKTPTAP